MNDRQLQLLSDARLSDAARILGLHLSTLGDGDHELNFDRLASLVHGTPQTETVGKHMRQLTVHGYAQRVSSGGRGSPRYRWVAESSAPKKIGPESSLPRNISAQTPTVVGSRKQVVEQNPPIVPPSVDPEPLDERTEAAIDRFSEKLAGCRGALRDYLRTAVPTAPRRYAYVNTVATWLDGADPSVWKLSTGTSLPPPERPRLLAAALNEMAAGDEKLMKRPVGDPGNLKTKLNVLLKQRGDHERNGNGKAANGGGASGARRGPAPSAPGANPNRRRSWSDALDDTG